MRLYHWTNNNFLLSIIIFFFSVLIWGCTAPQITQELITTSISADFRDIQIKLPSGSTVQEALENAQIILSELDRVEPPLYTVLSDNDKIKVIRIREEYFIEQIVIPFEHQELRNEALPEGESRLSQPGVNGLEEITYHRIYEDNVEISTNIVKSVVLQAAIPEILMIGSKSSFASMDISGKIAYLSAGNAWIIENTTGDRSLVVSTGDLDGRIFSLSPDGKLLVFSRFSDVQGEINTLWVALLQKDPVKIIDLGVKDVVHFAEFNPESTTLAYSTVEWRETAPGWQANNDLYELNVSASGFLGAPKEILEPNSGGIYGWWGMNFSWSPDETSYLYARPDGIGIIDREDGKASLVYSINPYQTGGNWAWVPGTSWTPDGTAIYTIDHLSPEANGAQDMHQFNLLAVSLVGSNPIHLVQDIGMFAYPVPSPLNQQTISVETQTNSDLNQSGFKVAYLQAIFPDQSETSGYKLCVIDRDGSNKKCLFPTEGALGLSPQRVVWSPEPIRMEGNYSIAFVYNGNIWIANTITGITQQITGDGLTTRIDWR